MQKLRVLLVEDTVTRQKHLLRLFDGHRCDVVDTGQAAIEALGSEPAYDVACLDYDLADDGTGADVANAMCTSPSAQAIVIVQSMNPEGVEAILAVLPDAFPIAIETLNRRTTARSMLRAALASGELARVRHVLESLSER